MNPQAEPAPGSLEALQDEAAMKRAKDTLNPPAPRPHITTDADEMGRMIETVETGPGQRAKRPLMTSTGIPGQGLVQEYKAELTPKEPGYSGETPTKTWTMSRNELGTPGTQPGGGYQEKLKEVKPPKIDREVVEGNEIFTRKKTTSSEGKVTFSQYEPEPERNKTVKNISDHLQKLRRELEAARAVVETPVSKNKEGEPVEKGKISQKRKDEADALIARHTKEIPVREARLKVHAGEIRAKAKELGLDEQNALDSYGLMDWEDEKAPPPPPPPLTPAPQPAAVASTSFPMSPTKNRWAVINPKTGKTHYANSQEQYDAAITAGGQPAE